MNQDIIDCLDYLILKLRSEQGKICTNELTDLFDLHSRLTIEKIQQIKREYMRERKWG